MGRGYDNLPVQVAEQVRSAIAKFFEHGSNSFARYPQLAFDVQGRTSEPRVHKRILRIATKRQMELALRLRGRSISAAPSELLREFCPAARCPGTGPQQLPERAVRVDRANVGIQPDSLASTFGIFEVRGEDHIDGRVAAG